MAHCTRTHEGTSGSGFNNVHTPRPVINRPLQPGGAARSQRPSALPSGPRASTGGAQWRVAANAAPTSADPRAHPLTAPRRSADLVSRRAGYSAWCGVAAAHRALAFHPRAAEIASRLPPRRMRSLRAPDAPHPCPAEPRPVTVLSGCLPYFPLPSASQPRGTAPLRAGPRSFAPPASRCPRQTSTAPPHRGTPLPSGLHVAPSTAQPM